MDSICHRRLFFRKAATIAAALVMVPVFVNAAGQTGSSKDDLAEDKRTPFINSASRFYCFKDGRVELSAIQKSGARISHIYNPGLEVEVLLLIAHNKPINDNLKEMAKRYAIPESVCQNRIDKMMNEFESKELICYGKPVVIKETETLYA